MKKLIGVLSVLVLMPLSANAACRVSDLLQCLDSVCAENVDMEPGARCYSCGTSAAKRPEKTEYKLGGDTPGMQSLAVGRSSRNTISDKELKNAPKDPGDRYKWATVECAKKVNSCTADDVSDNYDKLIDASCKIALGESEYAAVMKNAKDSKKTAPQCESELSACLLAPTKCDATMLKCELDADFNRLFAVCMSEASGCGDFTTTMRDNIKKQRDDMVAKKNNRINELIQLKKMERQEELESANRLCSAGGKESCIIDMCANLPTGLNSNKQCADADERMWAASLCKFVDTACNRLK